MKIIDALPDRKVKVIIFAFDGGKAFPIFRGSSRDNDKIFQEEFLNVCPSTDTYKFYCRPID